MLLNYYFRWWVVVDSNEGKAGQQGKTAGCLEKGAQKPVPAQKAEPEKGNIVGCQADRLNDFAARSPDC